MRACRTWSRRRIERQRPKPCRRSPHEFDVTRLVEKFVYVGAFVGNNHDSKELVFKCDTAVALVDELHQTAAMIAIVIVGLVSHVKRVKRGGEKVKRRRSDEWGEPA